MKKYFIKLYILIVILFMCHTGSAQIASKPVKFEDLTYTVSIDSIIDNTEGTISVKIQTEEDMVLPIRKDEVVYPLLMKMVAGQDTIMPTKDIVLGPNFIVLFLRTSKTPDKIIIYGNDDKKTEAVFTVTKNMIIVKKEPDDNSEEGGNNQPQRRMLSSQEGGLPTLKDHEQQAGTAKQSSEYWTALQKADVHYEKKFFVDIVLAGMITSPKEGEGITFAGYGVGFGYLLNNKHRFYVDMGVYEYWGDIIDKVSIDYTLVPVTASWNYVFILSKKINFRIGPTIGFASLSAMYEPFFGEKTKYSEKIANSFLAGAEMGLSWDFSRLFKLEIGYKSLVSPGFNVDGLDFSDMLMQPLLSFGIKF